MSRLLTRLRRRSRSLTERRDSAHSSPEPRSTSSSGLEIRWAMRIHPDLDALVAEHTRPLGAAVETKGLRPSPSFRLRKRRHSSVDDVGQLWFNKAPRTPPDPLSDKESESPEREYATAPSTPESKPRPPPMALDSPVPDSTALWISPRLTSRFSVSTYGYSPPPTGHSAFGRQLTFRLGLSAFGGRPSTHSEDEHEGIGSRLSRRRWEPDSPLLHGDSRSPSLHRRRSRGRTRSPASFRSRRMPRSAFSSPSPLPSSSDEFSVAPSSRRTSRALAWRAPHTAPIYRRPDADAANNEYIHQLLSRRSPSPVSIVISLNSGTESSNSFTHPHDSYLGGTYTPSNNSNTFRRTMESASRVAPTDVDDTPDSPAFPIHTPSRRASPSSYMTRLRDEYLEEARERRERNVAIFAGLEDDDTKYPIRFQSLSHGRRLGGFNASPRAASSPQFTTYLPSYINADVNKDLPPTPPVAHSAFESFDFKGPRRTFRSQSSKRQRSRNESGRRTSADWSARQAAEGLSWEADVARELISYGDYTLTGYSVNFGSSRDFAKNAGDGHNEAMVSAPAAAVSRRGRLGVPKSARDRNNPGRDDTTAPYFSTFPGYLSYTQPIESLEHPHRRDTSARTLTIPAASIFRRKDKKKGKTRAVDSDMHPSNVGNTVTFTDHDRSDASSPSYTRYLSPRRSASTRSGNASRDSVGRSNTPSPPKSALRHPRPQADPSVPPQLPTLDFSSPIISESADSRNFNEAVLPAPLPSALKVRGSGSNLPQQQLSRSDTATSKGKRKAEDVDGGTPPKEHRATFVVESRSHRVSATSGSSRAPSSYHRKRARLSASETLSRTASHDRDVTVNTGTWSSRSSAQPATTLTANASTPVRAPSRSSARETLTRSIGRSFTNSQAHQATPRRSMSQMSATSIPISALVSPHPPSVSVRSQTYHMRDPRRPPKPFETPWSLQFATPNEPGSGSPVHAWMFSIGFLFFPLWWFASFWRIPHTRHAGGTEAEKAVPIDDPQVEFDAKSWRFRCRVMAFISLFTYIPFIVLLAVFVPR